MTILRIPIGEWPIDPRHVSPNPKRGMVTAGAIRMYGRVALLATVLIVLTLPLGWRIGAQWGGSAAAGAQRASLVQAIATTVAVEGRQYPVKMVKARLSGVRIKVGLAEGRVGHTESLAGIAQRYAAVAGINGSFFEAHTGKPLKKPA